MESPDKKFILELLRNQAENLFKDRAFVELAATNKNVQEIFHELQLHQLELETQNDELSIASTALELERSKFYNLFHMAPVGYLVLNNSASILDINAAGSKLLGIRKELLTGKLLSTFIHADNISTFYTYFRSLRESETEQSCQVSFYNSNAEYIFLQLNGIRVSNSASGLFYLTITNITDKILAEQKLHDAKRRLDTALGASMTGIWEIEISTGKTYLDHYGCHILGTDIDEFDGRYSTFLNCITPSDREMLDAAIRYTFINEKELNVEFTVDGVSGKSTWVLARGRVIGETPEVRRFIGTVTDITSRKQMEQESQKLKRDQQQLITAAALQAEENERKRLSETLHDGIGQMLYAIKLNLPFIKSDDAKLQLNQIYQLLDQTIHDVRNISFELAPSILKDFGLDATLQEMTKRLSTPTLTVQYKVTGVTDNMDSNFNVNVFRIIQELVNNSIKHSGGNKINIELINKASKLQIQVIDNGKGFAGPPSQQVSGTGLSSIRNRLNLYNGTIDIRSTPGKGTIVTVKLETKLLIGS